MKQISTFIFLLLLAVINHAQTSSTCLPKDFVVAAENLNFREQPNLEAPIIGQLDNNEPLTLLEIVRPDGKQNIYWFTFNDNWLKVKRKKTGATGYVFGKYIKPAEVAFFRWHDADRLPAGNWYGAYENEGKTILEKTEARIDTTDEAIVIKSSHERHRVIICSQQELDTGAINDSYYFGDQKYLKIGDQINLKRSNKTDYSLVCTGEVTLDPPTLHRKNERVIFLTTLKNGGKTRYIEQDLTNCMTQFGEVGYMIGFAGDLNKDGVPELILYEGTTHYVNVYYFKSNEDGKLELQSITGAMSRC